MVYATRGLVVALLEYAREHDPESVTINISTTRAADIPDADMPPETPVFTHFDLPGAGRSVSAVFGVDLGTPPGAAGRFVSHPDGFLGVSQTDDLHEVLVVAVPPWDESAVGAFGRDGSPVSLELLDVAPPEESMD